MATNITARQSLKKFQKGTALTEAVIVLPVLLIILGILIDTYYIVHAYEALNRATREAMIIGSVLQELEGQRQNISSNLNEYNNCLTAPNNDCAHRLIHWRVRRILESQNSGIKDNSLDIKTVVPNVNLPFKRVTLFVSGRVNGVTPLSSLLTIRVQETVAILGE